MQLLAVIILSMITLACGSTNSAEQNPTAIPPTEVAIPYDGPLVSDLLELDDMTPLTIVFEWLDADPRFILGPGIFVWREGGGIRRWDEEHTNDVDPAIGSLRVFESGAAQHCVWVHRPKETDVFVDCDVLGQGGLHTGAIPGVASAMDSRVTGRYRDRTIAGRDAECYLITEPNAVEGTICIDAKFNRPLLVSMVNPETNERQLIVATSVETRDVDESLQIPDVEMRWQGPLESIALPSEFEFTD